MPWKPKPTKVFKASEVTQRGIHAFVREHQASHNYVVEGEHVLLSLPASDLLRLRRPTQAMNALDTVYETHRRLAGDVTPFRGAKILMLVVDKLCFHLCSGNPILIRRDRVSIILEDFNERDYPGWGPIHELGHDFVIAHDHAYVLSGGDNESWANVFTIHAYDALKLPLGSGPHWTERGGLDYYFRREPDYEKVKKDAWIMIGLLTIIKERYGWEPFYDFFNKCAQRVATKRVPKKEQAKVDFLTRELSLSAGENLAPYFVKWGFPVSAGVRGELQRLPQASLDASAEALAKRWE